MSVHESDCQAQQDAPSLNLARANEGSAFNPASETHPRQLESDVSNANSIEEYTAEEQERKLVRKLDRRILPILCLLYLFACEWIFD